MLDPETPVYVVAAGNDQLSVFTDQGAAEVMYTVSVGANLDTEITRMTYARWTRAKAAIEGEEELSHLQISEHFGASQDAEV